MRKKNPGLQQASFRLGSVLYMGRSMARSSKVLAAAAVCEVKRVMNCN
jgi:hypothetical protein